MSQRKPYPSDLSDARWALIEPTLSAWRKARLDRRPTGQPAQVELRDVFNAILYVNRTGIPWKYLPHDFPNHGTVYAYYAAWRDEGILAHALRDTGLALGLPPHVVDTVAKSFPHIRACDIGDALQQLPELRQLAGEADSYGPLWELAEGLDALPRGIAMHPCGVILSNATLLDRVPVQTTPGGQYSMVQADKEDVDSLGVEAVAVGPVSR
ncbi:transposase [Streptomyces sp. NPDC002206]